MADADRNNGFVFEEDYRRDRTALALERRANPDATTVLYQLRGALGPWGGVALPRGTKLTDIPEHIKVYDNGRDITEDVALLGGRIAKLDNPLYARDEIDIVRVRWEGSEPESEEEEEEETNDSAETTVRNVVGTPDRLMVRSLMSLIAPDNMWDILVVPVLVSIPSVSQVTPSHGGIIPDSQHESGQSASATPDRLDDIRRQSTGSVGPVREAWRRTPSQAGVFTNPMLPGRDIPRAASPLASDEDVEGHSSPNALCAGSDPLERGGRWDASTASRSVGGIPPDLSERGGRRDASTASRSVGGIPPKPQANAASRAEKEERANERQWAAWAMGQRPSADGSTFVYDVDWSGQKTPALTAQELATDRAFRARFTKQSPSAAASTATALPQPAPDTVRRHRPLNGRTSATGGTAITVARPTQLGGQREGLIRVQPTAAPTYPFRMVPSRDVTIELREDGSTVFAAGRDGQQTAMARPHHYYRQDTREARDILDPMVEITVYHHEFCRSLNAGG
jgi:hypothetical protein